MGRIIFMSVALLCCIILFVAQVRMVDPNAFRDERQYSEAEKILGKHCLAREEDGKQPIRNAIQDRIGGAVTIALPKIELSPLLPDGTHKMSIYYDILRIGQMPIPRKATGTLKNDDCSFIITTLER